MVSLLRPATSTTTNVFQVLLGPGISKIHNHDPDSVSRHDHGSPQSTITIQILCPGMTWYLHDPRCQSDSVITILPGTITISDHDPRSAIHDPTRGEGGMIHDRSGRPSRFTITTVEKLHKYLKRQHTWLNEHRCHRSETCMKAGCSCICNYRYAGK